MDHKLNIEDLQESLQTSFICKKHDSSEKYRSKFLINSGQFSAGNIQKVICDILDELRGCESFDISVAFITDGGVNLLTQTLLELKEKGIKGRILTTDYNLFSEPSALKELAKFENIDVRMYRCKEGSGFHVKSFIFNHSSQCNVIIGSSNLTQNALTTNQEWNVKFVSTFEGEMVFLIKKEFEKLWNDPLSFPLEEVIEEYEQERKTLKDLQRKAKAYISSLPQKVELKPNKMQESFIKKLDEIYHSGQNRALLISATGTGKTYAAAFSVKHLMEQKKPEHHKRPIKKVLFVVHREQIAIQAKNSFARVIGSEHGQTYGLLSGNHKDKECTFLFSTIQTLSLDRILKDFAPDAFDFIIIDEAHRSGANSYDKIMAHFQPEFWLGMTATPERTDDKDVFKIFNHQIAYEIRLKDALDYNLLCPFHYHGISDLKINNEEQKDFSNFAYLTSDERVKHVLQKAEEFKFSGERVKGLIFCSSVDEAKVLSEKLNQHNLRTTYLTGQRGQAAAGHLAHEQHIRPAVAQRQFHHAESGAHRRQNREAHRLADGGGQPGAEYPEARHEDEQRREQEVQQRARNQADHAERRLALVAQQPVERERPAYAGRGDQQWRQVLHRVRRNRGSRTQHDDQRPQRQQPDRGDRQT